MGDYEDEKPDWREIDRKKDSSRQYGRQEGVYKKDTPKDRWNIARRKEALDKLFMGEKGTIEHEKLFNKIHKSYGSGSFLGNIKKYIEKYDMPDDASTLILILDSKEQDIIFKTFDKIKSVYNGLPPRQKEDLRRKLSILKLTDKSAEVRERAEDILQMI
jgi:hypothetical protein